jgi:hypothetical protein
MEFIEQARARAAGGELPLLRLQALSRLSPALCGLLCAALVGRLAMAPVWLTDVSADDARELLGAALFYAASIGIIAGFAAPVLRSAARDLVSLAPVLPLPADEVAMLGRALCRETRRELLRYSVMAIVAGLVHSYLLGHHHMPALYAITQFVPTVLIWIGMFWTVAPLIRNAELFSRLGRIAEPDLLRPSRHAAFGAAALRPALFIIAILCAYPLLVVVGDGGLYGATLIGIAVTLFSLSFIVILPLRGIRRRIAQQRGAILLRLDQRLDPLTGADIANAGAEQLFELDALLDMRERVAAAPAWPLDLAGVRRILLYIVLPPLTWAAAALVEMAIDNAL